MTMNEDKETMTTAKKTKTRLRGKDAIWKLFLLLLVCALCCAKTAQAEEAETQPEEPVKPPPAGLGGIQRGQCRTEYADGVFVVGTCGRRGRELQINTHLVRTEADFEFWRDVQCREKLFVGNENGEIIEVGKSLRERKTAQEEMETKNCQSQSRNCELQKRQRRVTLALCDYVVEIGYVFPTPVAAATFSTTFTASKSSCTKSSSTATFITTFTAFTAAIISHISRRICDAPEIVRERCGS